MEKNKIVSPSLTVYRPELVTMMSIMGRATGIILSGGLYIWVVMLKLKPLLLTNYSFYFIIYELFKGQVGGIIISGITLFILIALYYHVVYAVRNIVWFFWEDKIDMSLENVYKVGYIILGITLFLSLTNWILLLI
jgi:succinate dehydrogenase / fumarate reductase cytochrome b subunit